MKALNLFQLVANTHYISTPNIFPSNDFLSDYNIVQILKAFSNHWKQNYLFQFYHSKLTGIYTYLNLDSAVSCFNLNTSSNKATSILPLLRPTESEYNTITTSAQLKLNVEFK